MGCSVAANAASEQRHEVRGVYDMVFPIGEEAAMALHLFQLRILLNGEMSMAKKPISIPKFRTEGEEAQWWDRHRGTEAARS